MKVMAIKISLDEYLNKIETYSRNMNLQKEVIINQ